MYKEFLYFPSFSAGNVALAMQKNQTLRKGLPIRFYSSDFPKEYRHPYFLMTAGSLYKNMDIRSKFGLDEPDIITLGDSGGYQIATGAMDWDPALVPRIMEWLENNSTVAMNLDIPPRRKYLGKFDECLTISKSNYKYFSENQSGKIDFLNVLQGDSEQTYHKWYHEVKDFDFNGWGIGGAAASIYRMMIALKVLIENGEHLNAKNKYLHILGTSKITDFFILSQLQKSFNSVGSTTQVTTDSSSPSRSVVYGLMYFGFDLKTATFKYLHIPKEFATNNQNRANMSVNRITSDSFSLPNVIPFDNLLEGQTIIQDYVNWTTEGCANLVLHNFMFFKHVMSVINQFVNTERYILEQAISKDLFSVLTSIDEMVQAKQNGESVEKVFVKYKQLYLKLSNTNAIITETKNEFFEF